MEYEECEIKEELDLIWSDDVDELYCRCCFKSFSSFCNRNEMSLEFLTNIRDFFQFPLSFSEGSKWICNSCKEIVENFSDFKQEVIKKQAKYKILAVKQQHRDLQNIKNLSSQSIEREQDVLKHEEVVVKEESEALLNSIFISEVSVQRPQSKRKAGKPPKDVHQKPKKKLERPLKVKIEKTPLMSREQTEALREYIYVIPKSLNSYKRCKDCGKNYKDRNTHYNKAHGKSFMFRCSGCDYIAETREKTRFHIRNVHLRLRDIPGGLASLPSKQEEKPIFILPKIPKKAQKCTLCSKMCRDLIGHQNRHHGKKNLFRCSECGFSATLREKIRVHILNHHRDSGRKGTCEICGKNVKCIDKHIARTHKNEKNCFCDLCEFKTFERNAMRTHMQHNHLPKCVKCSHCDYTTINNHRLKNHMKNMHENLISEKFERIKCPYKECTVLLKRKFNLDAHIKRVHEGQLDFSCDFPGCDKLFFTKTEKKKHFDANHGHRDFICDLCGASFGTLHNLKSHTACHSAYDIVCKTCNAKFNSEGRLERHINCHHLLKRDFVCDRSGCKAAFFKKQSLTNHIASKHLGLRFQCGVDGCSSSLSRRDAYVNHLKSHTELTQAEKDGLVKKCKKFAIQKGLTN